MHLSMIEDNDSWLVKSIGILQTLSITKHYTGHLWFLIGKDHKNITNTSETDALWYELAPSPICICVCIL